MCTVDKVEYLSRMLADNAVELHRFSAPECTTIAAYPCGDHFHIGHSGLTDEERSLAAAACKAAHPFRVPLRPRTRRRPRARRAA